MAQLLQSCPIGQTKLPPVPPIPHLGRGPREMKTNVHGKKLYANVPSSITSICQKVKTIQCLINRWVGKHHVVYLYNGILFSKKKG